MAGGARASGLRKRKRSAASRGNALVQKRPRWTLGPVRSLTVSRMYPMPRTLRTTLRYYDFSHALNPSAGGAAATYVFSANGLFDPDITGVGHQPVGFDQLMAFYDHYTVVGAKITVDFQNNDTTNESIVGVSLRDDSTTTISPYEIVESGAIDTRWLTPLGKDGCKARITMASTTANYLGRKDVMSDPELKGSAAANPGEQYFFHLTAYPNSANDADIVGFHAIIDYDVIFHERKRVGIS